MNDQTDRRMVVVLFARRELGRHGKVQQSFYRSEEDQEVGSILC
jgi:hypothetical protein